MTAPDAGDEWLSLRDLSTRLDRNYDTLRFYSAIKYKETFPPPKIKTSRGKGMLWSLNEVREWYHEHDRYVASLNRSPEADPVARAKLGHKFREIRQRGQCTICDYFFKPDDTCWEVRYGDDLAIMCVPCNEKRLEREGAASSQDGIPATG